MGLLVSSLNGPRACSRNLSSSVGSIQEQNKLQTQGYCGLSFWDAAAADLGGVGASWDGAQGSAPSAGTCFFYRAGLCCSSSEEWRGPVGRSSK